MGVGAGLYMYDVVVKKFPFAISSPDEFLSYIAGNVVNPFTKFEEPTAIDSWVMSSGISHRIRLTMYLQPLHMRRITWPTHRGKFFPHIWNPWPQFAYSSYNLYGATMMFIGRLLLAPPMLKLFFGQKFLSTVKIGHHSGGFWEKRGVNVKFWVYDPEKVHPWAEPRLLAYFASKSVRASWL